jgi:serine/threonine protein phosphatase 1
MKRTFAISDLHGQYDLWLQIKDYLKPEDVLYCLGDSIDRGSDGIPILFELLNRENTYMIKGNHEKFLEQIVPQFIKGDTHLSYFWFINGGKPTWSSIERATDSMKLEIVKKIQNMPLRIDIKNVKGQNIILTHAGFNPLNKKLKHFINTNDIEGLESFYLWSRNHFDMSWSNEKFKNTYLVHGHTPVQIFYLDKIKKYANGHAFDIDMGSAYSNVAALFNLDTLEVEQYFTAREV